MSAPFVLTPCAAPERHHHRRDIDRGAHLRGMVHGGIGAQCPCGGQLAARMLVRNNMRLAFRRCVACGRVDGFRLQQGDLELIGPQAQRRWLQEASRG